MGVPAWVQGAPQERTFDVRTNDIGARFRTLIGAAAITFATLAAPVVGLPTVASADAEVAATLEEHRAMARTFRGKAKKYLEDAAMHRKMAARYRKARNNKGRKQPGMEKVAKAYEDMAVHDEALAKDADQVALYHERQVKRLEAKK